MKTRPRSFFVSACLFEGGLLVVAILLGKIFNVPVRETFRLNAVEFLGGTVATLPMIGLLFWMANTSWRPIAELTGFVRIKLRPLFQNWTVVQFLIVSLLAGLGEEFLFRAFLQEWLGRFAGEFTGLILASVLFGLVHWVTPAYGILAMIIGLYLGLLWQFTGSLLAVITVHSLYDFIALIYLVRFRSC